MRKLITLLDLILDISKPNFNMQLNCIYLKVLLLNKPSFIFLKKNNKNIIRRKTKVTSNIK